MQHDANPPAPKRSTRIARRLRSTQTSPEELLWRELRGRRLEGWKFRRQMPIAGHVVDFACVSARLTIEVDGKQHAEQVVADAERRRKIEAEGFLEIRFTNEDVLGRPAWVMEEIRRMLDIASNRPMRPALFRMD
jgi:very-short-patch-repair endonuclease